MDTKTFLEAVLGEDGLYCSWAFRGPKIVQTLHETIDEVIAQANRLDRDGFNTFFALATFKTNQSREAENAKQLRAFFLDIDCGEGKPFPTQAEGIKALQGFCKITELPKPTIINSGRGLHVYWRLEAAVDKEDWKPVAEAFKRKCQELEFNIDFNVPADTARVLRVPNTRNYKDNPPKVVHMVGELAPAVPFSLFENTFGRIEARRKPTGAVSSLTDAIINNFTSKFKTIVLRTAKGHGCAQIGHIIKNQEAIDEPLWRAGLSIAWTCSDRDTAIHRMSSKHPNYDAAVTEEKATLTKGPYLCETFDSLNPGVCTSCQHWKKLKSPISIGRHVEEAESEEKDFVNEVTGEVTTTKIPAYPDPYFQGKGGGVFRRGADRKGMPKDILIYHNPLYVIGRYRDPEVGETCVIRLHLPRDGVRDFVVPLAHVGSTEEFRTALAKQGVAVVNPTELKEYIMKWVNDLQFKVEAKDAHTQFGWTSKALETPKSFVLGDKEIFADKIETNPPSHKTFEYFPFFKTKGTMDEWRKIMDFYGQPNMEAYQFMIGMSFAAPLMHFLPINFFQFHMHSDDSGLGKTATLLALSSVWGDPERIMLSQKDTQNSRMNRLEAFKNVPVPFDEMTNIKPIEASDVLYALSSGFQRNRLSPKGNQERYRGEAWRTTVPTTGNASIIERVNSVKAIPKAEAQRIFEYEPRRIEFDTKGETDNISQTILKNYGHAAVPYLQYLLKDMQGSIDLLKKTQNRIDEVAGLKAQNRYWSGGTAAVITGLLIAKKCGFHNWDIGAIVRWAINRLGEAKEIVDDMSDDVETILQNYLSEHYSDILTIKSSIDLRGKTPTEMLVHPEARPRGALVGRYEYDVHKLYILPKPLRQWCSTHQISYSGLIDKLRTGSTKAVKQKVRLTRGTHMAMPAADVWVMDFRYDDLTPEDNPVS